MRAATSPSPAAMMTTTTKLHEPRSASVLPWRP